MTKKQEARSSSSYSALALALTLAVSGLGATLLTSPVLASSSSAVQLQTFRTHSRLAIALDSATETEWKEIPGGFELRIRGLTLADLYLGAGGLSRLKDSRLSSLKAEEDSAGVILRGKWHFGKGATALADPSMERFVYRDGNPARFIVDFWPKAGLTVGEAKKKAKERERGASAEKAKQEARKRQERRAASQRALEVESDVARFCKLPLRDGEDIFLGFEPFHESPDLSPYLPRGKPDEGYAFVDLAPDAPDAKYVRLALELYGKKDYALSIRTVEFLEKESPESIHLVDMRFLKANALLRLGMRDSADALFEELTQKHPGTPAALASGLYLAESTREEGQELRRIDRYLRLATQFPNHRNVWAWRMAAAESLYGIKQIDRAISEYEWIAENASDRAGKAMAALRMGDAYLRRKQYDRALAAYFEASKVYPKEAGKLASVQVNRGEALYWLGQYDRAAGQFKSFVDAFPGHPAGWRALLRLAEIEGRKSGDQAIAASRALFLETTNRYPFSPGATIARMRLMPCGDHGGFDAASASDFFKKETEAFDGGGEILTDRFEEFRSMVRVRSMVLLNDEVAALEATIRESEEVNRKSGAYAWLGDMQRKLFRKRILSLLDEGKRFEAVRFYEQYAKKVDLRETLPEEAGPDRIALADPEYLLRLSRVAAELGLGRTAGAISQRYDAESRHLGLNRSIASGTSLEARLKRSERAFTEAKALWAKDPIGKEKEIREKLAEMTDESPFSYQKEIILGLIAEREKKWSTALSHSAKSTLLLSKLAAEGSIERIVLDQWIAGLHEGGGNLESALEGYKKLQRSNPGPGERAKAEGVGIRPAAGKAAWAMKEAEIAGKLGRWGDSAAALGRVVEAGEGGNFALYQYALSLEKSGTGVERVDEAIRKVAESDVDDFWRELARKRLAGANAKEGNAL